MKFADFAKTRKWMLAACMLSGTALVPSPMSATELQTCLLSMQTESTTLKDLFDLIEQKFNYSFLIRNNNINLNERVTVEVKEQSVEDILRTALKNQHADFIVNEKRIIIYKTDAKGREMVENSSTRISGQQQQAYKVTGTVSMP